MKAIKTRKEHLINLWEIRFFNYISSILHPSINKYNFKLIVNKCITNLSLPFIVEYLYKKALFINAHFMYLPLFVIANKINFQLNHLQYDS